MLSTLRCACSVCLAACTSVRPGMLKHCPQPHGAAGCVLELRHMLDVSLLSDVLRAGRGSRCCSGGRGCLAMAAAIQEALFALETAMLSWEICHCVAAKATVACQHGAVLCLHELTGDCQSQFSPCRPCCASQRRHGSVPCSNAVSALKHTDFPDFSSWPCQLRCRVSFGKNTLNFHPEFQTTTH